MMTKARKDYYIKLYNNSSCYSVADFYKSCSYYKAMAERNILKEIEMRNISNYGINCYGYKVLCGNCEIFSCGYVEECHGVRVLVVHTAYNTYRILLDS